MRILYIEWNSFGNEDMFEVFEKLGIEILKLPFNNREIEERLLLNEIRLKLDEKACDMVFSYNYFPNVSNCCKELNIMYVSWVYDSPYLQVYSYTVLNPCNRIFLFDYAVYEELHNNGISTVYYMPLGVNTDRIERMLVNSDGNAYKSDIAFVGSMYSEKKHRLYDKFNGISDYAKGYLEGLVQVQKQVHGAYLLQTGLNEAIIDEMEKAYPTDPNSSTVLSPRAIYADFVLARHVTALERKEILEILGKEYGKEQDIALYTYEGIEIAGVKNKGKIDYYDEMPYVFHNSRINLNITLRSIKTGIPLRAMDIMGSGGFMVSNYQSELEEYFRSGEDYICYEDYRDLTEKVAYYLENERARCEIARNAFEKVKKEHNLTKRVNEILEICKN